MIIDHKILAISRLASEFSESVNLINFFSTFLTGNQELENVLEDFLTGFSIDTAIGKQLDIIGIIVGIPRPLVLSTDITFFGFQGVLNAGPMSDEATPTVGGLFRSTTGNETGNTPLPDNAYRRAIRAQTINNTATGTIEDIIEVCLALIDVNQVIVSEISNITQNEVNLSFDRVLTANEVILLTELNLVPVAAGVRLNYVP